MVVCIWHEVKSVRIFAKNCGDRLLKTCAVVKKTVGCSVHFSRRLGQGKKDLFSSPYGSWIWYCEFTVCRWIVILSMLLWSKVKIEISIKDIRSWWVKRTEKHRGSILICEIFYAQCLILVINSSIGKILGWYGFFLEIDISTALALGCFLELYDNLLIVCGNFRHF